MKIESSLNEYNYNLSHQGMANVTDNHHVTSEKWAIPARSAGYSNGGDTRVPSHVRDQHTGVDSNEGITIQVLRDTPSPHYGSPPSRLSPVDLPAIRPRSRSLSSTEPLVIKTDSRGKPRVISASKPNNVTDRNQLKFPKIGEKKNLVETVNTSERIKKATNVAKQKGSSNDPLDFFRRALSGDKQPFLKSNVSPVQRARQLIPGADSLFKSPSPRKPLSRSPRPLDKPSSPPSRNTTSPNSSTNTSPEPDEKQCHYTQVRSKISVKALSNNVSSHGINNNAVEERIPSPQSDFCERASSTQENECLSRQCNGSTTEDCQDKHCDTDKRKPKTRNAVINIMVEESDNGETHVVQSETTYFQTSDDKIREFFDGADIDFSACSTQPFRQRAGSYTFGNKFKELKERLGNADIVITELD